MEQVAHLKVNGIGDANVLAIARHHSLLGLSQQDCVQRILDAPSILKSNLTKKSANDIATTLEKVGLPCTVIDGNPDDAFDDLALNDKSLSDKYEIAAYITDFASIAEFAGKVAAFTGQSGEDIIRSLANTPATLLGNLSQTVAEQLAHRFSGDGVEVLVSCPKKAHYSLIAYVVDEVPAVQQYYAQMGMQRVSQNGNSDQWQAQDVSFEQAQKIWQKANEAHLPIVIQNHDYMRFDILLQSIEEKQSSQQLQNLQTTLLTHCGIPKQIHSAVLKNLPVVIKRCVHLDKVQKILTELHESKATVEAILVGGVRFNLSFPNWQSNHANALNKVCQTVMGRTVSMPGNSHDQQNDLIGTECEVSINANLHQAMWIQYECSRQNIDSKLMRVS